MRFPAILATLLVLGGCGASSEMRQNARAVISQMRGALDNHEDSSKAALTGVCRSVFDQLALRLEAEAKATACQLKNEVYAAVAQKRGELRTTIESRLEEALDPLLARLKNELDAEKQKNAGDVTLSRDRELTLATQLATTLAIAQQEAGKLAVEAEKQLAAVQATLLTAIDEESAAKAPKIDAADLTAKLLASWEIEAKNDASFRTGMSGGFDELKRFVDEESALTLTLQGLFGDRLGSKLASLLADKTNQVVADGSGKLKDWLDERKKKIGTDVAAKAQEAIEAARAKG